MRPRPKTARIGKISVPHKSQHVLTMRTSPCLSMPFVFFSEPAFNNQFPYPTANCRSRKVVTASSVDGYYQNFRHRGAARVGRTARCRSLRQQHIDSRQALRTRTDLFETLRRYSYRDLASRLVSSREQG